MNAKYIVLLAVGVSLAAGLGAVPPPTPTAVPAGGPAIEQMRAAAAQLAGGAWNAIQQVSGAGIAVARPAAKIAYVGAVLVPGQTNSGEAGFKLGSLVSGVPIDRVTVRGFFRVQSIGGSAECRVAVFDGATMRQVALGTKSVTVDGPYDVETSLFRMEVGKRYVVWATVQARPDAAHPGRYAIVEIPEIRWQM